MTTAQSSRNVTSFLLSVLLLTMFSFGASAQNMDSFFYKEKVSENGKLIIVRPQNLFKNPDKDALLQHIKSVPGVIEVLNLDELSYCQMKVESYIEKEDIVSIFQTLGIDLIERSERVVTKTFSNPVLKGGADKAIECCFESVSASGYDDDPTVASITFSCAPSGAVFTSVTLDATIGSWCPDWYSMDWNVGGNWYYGMCDGANDYADLNGQTINGTTVSVSSWDEDLYSDGITITLQATACWDNGIAPQQIIAVLDGTNPAASGGYTDICPGASVTFNAHGDYPDNGTTYTQSDATSTFTWDFGDGDTQSGVGLTSVTHSYADPGGYDVDLTITDVQGGTSANDIGHRVRVSTTPVFAGTTADDFTICAGACTDITGVVTPTPWSQPTGATLAGETYLPDGTGVWYTTDLNFDEFTPGQTVTSASDIESICMNIEHSYIGDLIAYIECPNGQTADLFDGNNAVSLAAFLGEAIDDVTSGPGVGYDYCFDPTSGNGTITDAATTMSVPTPSDTYVPEGDFNGLVGCPLNGTWTIHIQDDMGSDDGYIFSWGINFDPSLYPALWGFTPSIVSESWSGEGVSGTNPATACPTSVGDVDYLYEVTDDFGCTYDTTITIEVTPGMTLTPTVIDAQCYHNCDGQITVAVTNGTAQFDYVWENTAGTYSDNTNSSSLSSNTISSLCADEYNVTVTDAEGCEAYLTTTVDEPAQMTVNFTSTDENCGLADGTISSSVSGGTANYSYVSVPAGVNESNQSSSETFTGLSAGSYVITVTDANSCTAVNSVDVNGSGSVNAAFSYVENQCYDASGNSVVFTNSSTGATSYTWDFDGNGTTDSTDPNPTWNYTAPGIYNVTLTAISGACTHSVSMNVTIYDLPTLALTPSDASCNAYSDGEIVAVAAAGGAAGSSVFTDWEWSDGQTTSTATGLSAGTYTVTVTDNLNCTATETVTISEPAAIGIVPATVDLTCYGICTGEAHVVSVSGGSGNFSYAWSNTETTQNITGLCAGTYSVTVSDDASIGCVYVETYNVSQPPEMTLATSSISTNCGQADGSATVTITNGVADYSVDWSNSFSEIISTTTSTNSNIAAGAYDVTVTDADGCIATSSVNVNDLTGPSASITGYTDILCNGDCTGDMTVTVSGGNSPYTYNWDGNGAGSAVANTTDTEASLCAGAHSVVITDDNGCVASASETLTEPSALSISVSTVDANCGTLGSATATVTGGVTNYDYLWSSGGTDATENNLSPGTYTVDVTDNNGCTISGSGTVVDVGGMSASITSSTNVSCNGGNDGDATVEVSGGTASYTYNWGTGDVTSSETTNIATGLSAGVYEVTVTDVNLCGATTTVTITEPSLLEASITNTVDATCNGYSDGSLTVTPTGGAGGYTYLWDANASGQVSATATGLSAGSYSVTVEDQNGCSVIVTGTVAEPDAIVVSAQAYTAHCDLADGGAEVISASGGNTGSYTYAWSGGTAPLNQDTVGGLSAAGSPYTVTVTDILGCTGTDQVTVPNAPGGIATISSYEDVSCAGASDGWVTVSCSGTSPFTYNWTGGGTDQTATGLGGGTYDVTVTDHWGCTATASQVIGEPLPLTLDLPSSEPDCHGGMNGGICANVTGGTTNYSYLWSNGGNTQCISVGYGYYCVTVTDANGCIITGCDSVTQPDPIQIQSAIVDANCSQSDGSVSLVTSGGTGTLTVEWSNGSSGDTLANIPAGTYTVTVTDAKSCSNTDTYTVANLAGPVAVIDTVVHILCNGGNNGSSTVSVTGGTSPYDYIWSSGGTNAIESNLTAGNYTVTVIDANHCIASLSVEITEPDALGLNYFTQDPACYDSTNGWASVVPYGGTSPYSYQWNGGGNNQTDSLNTGMGSGSYSVVVTDANNCNILQNISISQPAELTMAVGSIASSCFNTQDGQAFVYNVSGGTPHVTNGYYYEWGANANAQLTDTAFQLVAGNYCVTVTDGVGCQQTACVTVSSPTPMEFQSVTFQDNLCFGDTDGTINSIVVGGSPGYDFLWANDSGQLIGTSSSIGNLAADTYCLTVTDNYNCNIDTCITISQPPPLTLTIEDDSLACYGDCNGVLNAVSGGGQFPYSVLWSNFQTNFMATSLCDGNYCATVTDNNGCTISACADVIEPPLLQIADVIITDATCGNADGCAEIVFNGGTVGYEFDWGFAGGNSISECDLAAGTYGVTVTDQNGCQTDTLVDVSNLDGPEITSVAVSHVTCAGFSNGTATISFDDSNPPAEPYTINWSNGQVGNTASGLSGGSYSVQVVDTNLCLDSYSFVVNEPDQLQAMVTSSTDADCYGACNGTAIVSAIGGSGAYSYLWSNGDAANYADELCAQAYSVVVTDANSCTVMASVAISEPAQLSMNVSVNDVDCYGADNGTITVSGGGGSGAYDITFPQAPWSNPPTASQLPPGTYTVIVSDQNAMMCSIDSTFTVGEADPIVPYVSTTPTTCNLANGTATIDSVTGGSGYFDFVWSPTNTYPTATGLNSTTNYVLQVIDVAAAAGCSVDQYVQVGQVTPPSINYASSEDPYCYGTNEGSAMVVAKDGRRPYQYTWDPTVAGDQDSVAYDLFGGMYNVTVTDADGCTAFATFLIDDPEPVYVYGSGSTTICAGQSTVISASANGGTFPWTYIWNHPAIEDSNQVQNVTPASTTTYSVSVVDANGCPSLAPAAIQVVVRPPLEVTLSATDTLVCEGDSIRLTASAVGGNGVYSYFWSTGGEGYQTSVLPMQDSLTYSVTVYDDGFCSAPDSAKKVIYMREAPDIDIFANLLNGCEPITVVFDNLPDGDGVSYEWNFGDASSGDNTSYMKSPVHTYEDAGTYNVSLSVTSVQYQCRREQTIENMIEVYPNPDADFNFIPDNASVFDAEIQFTDLSMNAEIWSWDFGDGSYSFNQNPVHIYQRADTFNVFLEVKTEYECIDTITKKVTIRPEHTFYAPTAFMPVSLNTLQQVEENAYFTPKATGVMDCPDCYKIWIFDRWGEVIFYANEFYGNTKNAEHRWNGRVNNNGKLVPVGSYTWYVQLIDVNYLEHEYVGSVTVIR